MVFRTTLPHCLHFPSCRRRWTQWCLIIVFCAHKTHYQLSVSIRLQIIRITPARLLQNSITDTRSSGL